MATENIKILKIDANEYKLDAFNADHAAEAAHADNATMANEAGKVTNKLTLKAGDNTKTYDGSAAVSFEITAANLGLSNALHFLGESTTDPAAAAVVVGGKTITPAPGDVVIYKRSGEARYEEYVYIDSTKKWELLGDADSHSIKGHTHNYQHSVSATASYTPEGTVSKPTFTGSKATLSHSHSYTPEGTTNTSVTPEGTITNTFANKGSNVNSHNFVGTEGDITVTGAATGDISIEYTPAASKVTPTFSDATASQTGAHIHDHSFAGTQGDISVTGDLTNGDVKITVPVLSSIDEHKYTPAGIVSKPTFAGTEGDIIVTGTATGGITLTSADSSSTTTVVKNVTSTNNTNVLTGVSVTGAKLSGSQNGNVLTLSNTSLVTTPTKATVVATVTPTYTTLGFSGTEFTSTGKFTPNGSVSQPTFTGTEATLSHTFDHTDQEMSGTATGSITSTGKFTPSGTISKKALAVSFTGKKATISGALQNGASTGSGKFTPSGNITDDTLTSVFNGTAKSYSGTLQGTPATLAADIEYTPAGDVSQPTFTGTPATITSGGTVSGETSSDVE